MSIKEFAKKLDANINDFSLERFARPEWVTQYKPNDKVLNGYVNLEAFNSHLDTIVHKKHAKNTFLNTYFRKLDVGVRLLYRPTGRGHDVIKSSVRQHQPGLNWIQKDFFEPGAETKSSEVRILRQTIFGDWEPPTPQASSVPNVSTKIRLELFWGFKNSSEEATIRNMLTGDQWNFSLLSEKNERGSKIYVEVNNGNYTKGDYETFATRYGEKNQLGQDSKYSDILDFLKLVK